MNIDELTIKQAKELSSMINGSHVALVDAAEWDHPLLRKQK